MSTQWTLDAGRTITTPNGSFCLTYGKDKYGNPHYRDFCELDRIAQQVAALPELLAALKNLLIYDTGEMPGDFVEEAKRAIAKAEGRTT